VVVQPDTDDLSGTVQRRPVPPGLDRRQVGEASRVGPGSERDSGDELRVDVGGDRREVDQPTVVEDRDRSLGTRHTHTR
jgi:hypothetical protein